MGRIVRRIDHNSSVISGKPPGPFQPIGNHHSNPHFSLTGRILTDIQQDILTVHIFEPGIMRSRHRLRIGKHIGSHHLTDISKRSFRPLSDKMSDFGIPPVPALHPFSCRPTAAENMYFSILSLNRRNAPIKPVFLGNSRSYQLGIQSHRSIRYLQFFSGRRRQRGPVRLRISTHTQQHKSRQNTPKCPSIRFTTHK